MPLVKIAWRHRQYYYSWRSRVFPEQQSGSLVDLLAGIITIAPSLTFALSGTSALPGVLAFAGTEPVLGFVDVAVDHELSGLLILVPVVSVKRFLIWEHLVEVFWVTFSGSDGGNQCNKSVFHHIYCRLADLSTECALSIGRALRVILSGSKNVENCKLCKK